MKPCNNEKLVSIRIIVRLCPVILSFFLAIGCKNFIEVAPPITSVNRDNVFQDKSYAQSVLVGIYSQLSNTEYSLNMSIYPELSADNLDLYTPNSFTANEYYKNILESNYTNGSNVFWNSSYSYIYTINSAIEGLTTSTSLGDNLRNRLLGEAFFLRGFFYYYLLNLFTTPPLVLSSDYSQNVNIPNGSPEQITSQIISDLTKAEQLLDNNYVDGTALNITSERVRPNKSAAIALLARIYLYDKQFEMAELEASKVIDQADVYSLTTLKGSFLKNSTETIWALQPVKGSLNTQEGYFYIYPDSGPNDINYSLLSRKFMESFENGDMRKTEWIGYYQTGTKTYAYPYKYKVKNGDPSNATEYTIVLRLAELYLIRAEARAQQGKIGQAVDDINRIRARSRAQATIDIPNPLPDIASGISKAEALDDILRERRVELFTEWGSRWFDLKRLGKIDSVMTVACVDKGGQPWQSYRSTFPIPLIEVTRDQNLKQNVGYK